MKTHRWLLIFGIACGLSVSAAAQSRDMGRPAGTPGGTHGAMSMGSGSGGSHGLFSHRPSVSNRLGATSHQQLDSRLEKLVGVTSVTDLQTAASKFKNLGQFVAAAHVYDNLGLASQNVTWSQFSAMAQSKGLGKTIHNFAPDANAKAQIKEAKKQAHGDLSQQD